MSPPRPIIVVTGANSGVGFGVCHRLLLQLSQSIPPDAKPQFKPLSQSQHTQNDEDIGIEPCDGITLILACRNEKRAIHARSRLLELLDEHILRERKRPHYDGHADIFRKNLEINFHAVDMSNIHSIFQLGDELSQKYPYISHLVCNAGCGTFNGIDWSLAIHQVLTAPIVGVTVTEYKRQVSGRVSNDGLGLVWQCNVFAHYAMYRYLQPLFKAYAEASSQPARVLWMSSLEGSPKAYNHDDWQLIRSRKSYEASKYEIDLIGYQLHLQSLAQGDDTSSPRHFVVHPGIAESNMSIELVGVFLDYIKMLLFYLVRLCGSPNHVISPYKAAIPVVHLSLVSLAFIPTGLCAFRHVNSESSLYTDSLYTSSLYPTGIKTAEDTKDAEAQGEISALKFGAETDRLGHERVGVLPILEWKEHGEEGQFLAEKCETLYQSYFKLEAGGRQTKANGNGNGLNEVQNL